VSRSARTAVSTTTAPAKGTPAGTASPASATTALAAPPSELSIDTSVARRIIGEFIQGQLRQAGFDRALVGLSGGIDSSLVAYLVSEAIVPERLLAVLMPYRTSDPTSRADGEEVVRRLGCESLVVDISPMVDAYFADPDRANTSQVQRGNFMARMRMAVLYDHSVRWGGLVVGTSNKTEILIGYTTIYGDSASAFNPIGDLYKTQIRQMAAAVGVPERIIRKAPSADLWPGQTDEEEGGFRYEEIDRLLYWMIDKRRSDEELVAMGFEPEFIARVERMVATSDYPRPGPPIAKIGPPTAGIDNLYPRRRPGSSRRRE
jgi:NAD+ synthase